MTKAIVFVILQFVEKVNKLSNIEVIMLHLILQAVGQFLGASSGGANQNLPVAVPDFGMGSNEKNQDGSYKELGEKLSGDKKSTYKPMSIEPEFKKRITVPNKPTGEELAKLQLKAFLPELQQNNTTTNSTTIAPPQLGMSTTLNLKFKDGKATGELTVFVGFIYNGVNMTRTVVEEFKNETASADIVKERLQKAVSKVELPIGRGNLSNWEYFPEMCNNVTTNDIFTVKPVGKLKDVYALYPRVEKSWTDTLQKVGNKTRTVNLKASHIAKGNTQVASSLDSCGSGNDEKVGKFSGIYAFAGTMFTIAATSLSCGLYRDNCKKKPKFGEEEALLGGDQDPNYGTGGYQNI